MILGEDRSVDYCIIAKYDVDASIHLFKGNKITRMTTFLGSEANNYEYKKNGSFQIIYRIPNSIRNLTNF